MIKCKYVANVKLYRAKLSWWKWLLGYCPCCGRCFMWPITTKCRHTQYCEAKNNYMTACKECHAEDDAYYDELWREYNAGRL